MSGVLKHFYPLAKDEREARKLVLKDFRVWLTHDVLKSPAVRLDPPAEMELRDAYERLCAIDAEDVLDVFRVHQATGFRPAPYKPEPVRGEESRRTPVGTQGRR